MKNKIKKHTTTLLIIGIIVAYLLLTYIVGVGFTLNPNVHLSSFTVSEDGTKITLKTTVPSPLESTRGFNSIKTGNEQYLDFYYTFGVANGTFGAKEEFIIDIDENSSGIFFIRDVGYELVLYKNPESNEWEIPKAETE